VFNIGTGRSLSVLDMANTLIRTMELPIKPDTVGKFRAGDIRHCYGDISKAQRRLGYVPRVRFEDGIADLVKWAQTQESQDLVGQAIQELEQHGLAK
jgi:dTDP-L-rhamnose 4-epimerase